MPPDPVFPLPLLGAGACWGLACWGAVVLAGGRDVGAAGAGVVCVGPAAAPVLVPPVPPPVAPPLVALDPALVGELAAAVLVTAATDVVWTTGVGAGARAGRGRFATRLRGCGRDRSSAGLVPVTRARIGGGVGALARSTPSSVDSQLGVSEPLTISPAAAPAHTARRVTTSSCLGVMTPSEARRCQRGPRCAGLKITHLSSRLRSHRSGPCLLPTPRRIQASRDQL